MPIHRTDLDAAVRASPILAELVDEVGLDVTLAIVGRWGGAALYVPQSLPQEHDNHELIRIAGRTAAKKLVWTYGGCTLNVPKGEHIRKLFRDEKILLAHGEGKKICEIAHEFSLTARTVRKVLQAARARQDRHRKRQERRPKRTKKTRETTPRPKPVATQLDLFS